MVNLEIIQMLELLENDFKTSITATLPKVKVNNLEMNGKMKVVSGETESTINT